MLTEEDINLEVQNDFANYYNKPYDGELPDSLIELFKIALFKVPPQIHQLHVSKLKYLCNVKPRDLTVIEVGIVMNVIMAASFDVLYKDLEESLDSHGELEIVQMKYNKDVAELENRCVSKRNSMLRLSNIHPKNANFKLAYNK